MSKTMSLTPALSSLSISSACFCRGQGQTADLVDRRWVDRHQDNVAGGLPRKPAEPHIGEDGLQHLVRPGEKDDRQDAQDKNMRSMPFHP